MKQVTFLPTTKEEMKQRGWDQVDFTYVIGDAYVDHPSFGPAIISRVLEAHGYRVGIIAQPNWKEKESISVFGQPRLGFLVSAGNMDSMVNHYTVAKKRRKQDAYTPGGKIGKRPNRAVICYSQLIRQTYQKVPIILGGIEASLRRLAHYDYWMDRVRRSVLLDSGADLISYGMGERSIVEIADALNSGLAISDITFLAGTVYRAKTLDAVYDPIVLPSYEAIVSDKKAFAKSFQLQYENTDPFTGKCMVEAYGKDGYVIQNPPAKPLTTQELDDVYALAYTREAHPSYQADGGVPAMTELRYSLTSQRGCFGACHFCALTFHQGRIIQARSHQSLVEEATEMTKEPSFHGYIHDVGGPTANFRKPSCKKQQQSGVCKHRECLTPSPCKNLQVDHNDYLCLLRKLRALPKVKKVFIRSGIRFDYVMYDQDRTFLKELCQYHVSGQLKVAPEHVSATVLRCMGKPDHQIYRNFLREYEKQNRILGKKQYVVPYFISSHPGSSLKEAIELACYIHTLHFLPEQVQDFYPTPSTISTCMYYTGLDPKTMKPVYVARSPHEKAMQRALLQYRNPKNEKLVREALHLAGRTDLIGFGKQCLLRPSNAENRNKKKKGKQMHGKDHYFRNRSRTAPR